MSDQDQKPPDGAPALNIHSIAQIQRARSLIRADNNGHYLDGALVRFRGQASYARAVQPSNTLCARAGGYINQIVEDISRACALLRRLQAMHSNVLADAMPVKEWLLYGPIDIESFHVQIRSLFDYMAKCAKLLAVEPAQAPSSFNGLLKWVRKPSNARAAGPALVQLFDSIAWFPKLRDIRDGAVHRGAITMVFFEWSEKLLFQVDVRYFDTQLASSFLATNKNGVVDFRLYAAAIFVETLDLLERFGNELLKQLPSELLKQLPSMADGDARLEMTGLEVVAQYLDLYLAAPR